MCESEWNLVISLELDPVINITWNFNLSLSLLFIHFSLQLSVKNILDIKSVVGIVTEVQYFKIKQLLI